MQTTQKISSQPTTDQILQVIEEYYDQPRQDLNYRRIWKYVLKWKIWSKLRRLQLFECQVIDNDIHDIIQLCLPDLEQLHLNRNKLTEKGIQILELATQNSLKLEKIRSLNLDFNLIKDQGLEILLRKVKNLKKLDIVQCGVTKIVMSIFVKFQDNLANLQVLQLGQNVIGSIGIKHLIKTYLPNLTDIYLKSCKIGNQGYKSLTKVNWPNLKSIEHKDNEINSFGYNMANQYNFKIPKIYVNTKDEPIQIMSFVYLLYSFKSENNYLNDLVSSVMRGRNNQKE